MRCVALSLRSEENANAAPIRTRIQNNNGPTASRGGLLAIVCWRCESCVDVTMGVATRFVIYIFTLLAKGYYC